MIATHAEQMEKYAVAVEWFEAAQNLIPVTSSLDVTDRLKNRIKRKLQIAILQVR